MAEDLNKDPVFVEAAEFFKNRPEGVLERPEDEVASFYALPVNEPQKVPQEAAEATTEKPRRSRSKS